MNCNDELPARLLPSGEQLFHRMQTGMKRPERTHMQPHDQANPAPDPQKENFIKPIDIVGNMGYNDPDIRKEGRPPLISLP